MRSDSRITYFTLILATVLASLQIASCNDRQKNNSHIDQITISRTKELVDKYKEGKEIFSKYCNTCHISPDKKATDQILFDNLFGRLSSDYVIQYINDSKKLKLSGDKYAIAVAKAYNSNYDHSFKDSLSNIDFDNLIIYMKVATH